jgi:hypothetical protein
MYFLLLPFGHFFTSTAFGAFTFQSTVFVAVWTDHPPPSTTVFLVSFALPCCPAYSPYFTARIFQLSLGLGSLPSSRTQSFSCPSVSAHYPALGHILPVVKQSRLITKLFATVATQSRLITKLFVNSTFQIYSIVSKSTFQPISLSLLLSSLSASTFESAISLSSLLRSLPTVIMPPSTILWQQDWSSFLQEITGFSPRLSPPVTPTPVLFKSNPGMQLFIASFSLLFSQMDHLHCALRAASVLVFYLMVFFVVLPPSAVSNAYKNVFSIGTQTLSTQTPRVIRRRFRHSHHKERF